MEAQPQCSCWEYGGRGEWGVGAVTGRRLVWGRSEGSQISGDWHSRDTVGSHFVVGETDTLKTERPPEAHRVMTSPCQG